MSKGKAGRKSKTQNAAAARARAPRTPWGGSMDLQGSEISRILLGVEISRICSENPKILRICSAFFCVVAAGPQAQPSRPRPPGRGAHRRRSRDLDEHREHLDAHMSREPRAARACFRPRAPRVARDLQVELYQVFSFRNPTTTCVGVRVREWSQAAVGAAGRGSCIRFRAFRAFDTAQKFRDVDIISRICSDSREISLTPQPGRKPVSS